MTANTTDKATGQYTCPMHPEVAQDTPGLPKMR